MQIVWDERKRLANIDKHGLDFRTLTPTFFANARIDRARGSRYKAIGRLGGEAVVVIFSPLGTEGVSIISYRAAGASERRLIQ